MSKTEKDVWTNPDDGTVHPDMDPPINPEHEKIRREKIRRLKESPSPRPDKRPAPIEESPKKVVHLDTKAAKRRRGRVR